MGVNRLIVESCSVFKAESGAEWFSDIVCRRRSATSGDVAATVPRAYAARRVGRSPHRVATRETMSRHEDR